MKPPIELPAAFLSIIRQEAYNPWMLAQFSLVYSSTNAIMQVFCFAFSKILLGFQVAAFQGCFRIEQYVLGPNVMMLQS